MKVPEHERERERERQREREREEVTVCRHSIKKTHSRINTIFLASVLLFHAVILLLF